MAAAPEEECGSWCRPNLVQTHRLARRSEDLCLPAAAAAFGILCARHGHGRRGE